MFDMRSALKRYVSENGLKITFISNKTNIPIDQLSRAFNKERGLSADEFMRICDVLNVDPWALVKDEENLSDAEVE